MLPGVFVAIFSTFQYRKVLGTVKPVEIPEGYWTNLGVVSNLIIATLGIVLMVYFVHGI